jgi:hypothetical protein
MMLTAWAFCKPANYLCIQLPLFLYQLTQQWRQSFDMVAYSQQTHSWTSFSYVYECHQVMDICHFWSRYSLHAAWLWEHFAGLIVTQLLQYLMTF